MFITLFLLFIILDIISFFTFKEDIIAPPFLFCISYTFSLFCALLNYNRWGLENYSLLSFSILFLGGIIFIFVGWVAQIVYQPKYYDMIDDFTVKRYVSISSAISYLLIIFNIITLLLYYRSVKNVAGNLENFSQMMESYREQSAYTLNSTQLMPDYVTHMSRIVFAEGYVYGFILVKNWLFGFKNWKDVIKPVSIIITYVVMSILSSDRLSILQLTFAMIIYYFALKGSSSLKQIGKSLLRVTIIVIIILLVFYSIRVLVGRVGSTDASIKDYLTMYSGGSIKLLDMYLSDPIHSSTWGVRTFLALHDIFRAMGMYVPETLNNVEFRSFNGISLGNVYTAYRDWYTDFSLSGTLILQTIFAAFYNFYYFSLKKHGFEKHEFATLIFGYMGTAVLLHPISDFLFSVYCSVGFCEYLVIFYVLYLILIKHKGKPFYENTFEDVN